MAHYEKYDRHSITNQFKHDSRENTDKRERIDKERSYLNYNLCDVKNPIEYNKQLIEMIKEQGGRIRKDSVYMCSVIITLPKTFPDSEELERQFFESAKRGLDEIHGKDNCLSCWIHLDESQPHMHYRFCPRVFDEEKQRYKLCAKEILNRNFLKSFHNKLSDYMEEELGFKVDILNGATKNGHKEIEELIAMTEKEKEIKNLIESDYKIKEARRKQIINEYWKEYQKTSKNYWENYKAKKEDINLCMIELKRQIYGTERQLYKDLDFISNLSNGLVFAVISLISAVITLTCKNILEHELNELKSDLEQLNDKRRSISNYQNNVKEKLKREDLEEIEKAMMKWEKSLNNIDAKLQKVTQEKEEYYIDYER